VERIIGHLRGQFGVAVTARDIPQRELSDLSVRVHGRLGLLLDGCGLLLLAPGFDAGFVVRGQDFRAVQVFVGINVLLLLRVFARSFLASGFSNILGRLGAALRGAGEYTGAQKDGESAAQRLAKRNPPVYMRLG
jgi:hypothetical protein